MRPILALISSFALAATSGAQDWPAFRGPAGNGISTAEEVPISWDRQTNVKWKVALPRPANGSPIASKGAQNNNLPNLLRLAVACGR